MHKSDSKPLNIRARDPGDGTGPSRDWCWVKGFCKVSLSGIERMLNR